jgi:hypothetical protein
MSSIVPIVLRACRRISTSSRCSPSCSARVPQATRALGVLAVHAQGRDVRVGQPELASGPERLQRGHGFPGRAAAPRPSDRPGRRAPPTGAAAGRPRATGRPALEGIAAPPHRLDRLVAVVGQEGGVEAALVERDALLARAIPRSAGRARMCAAASRWGAHQVRARGGLGANRSTAARVTGTSAWWRAARAPEHRWACAGQRRQRGPMQSRPAVRRQGLLDRHPGELVAEGDTVVRRDQHPEPRHSSKAASSSSPASASSSHTPRGAGTRRPRPAAPPPSALRRRCGPGSRRGPSADVPIGHRPAPWRGRTGCPPLLR